MRVLETFNTLIGVSLSTGVLGVSLLLFVAGCIRYSLYTRRSRVIGEVVTRKSNRMSFKWSFQGEQYLTIKGHPFIFLTWGSKVPLRVQNNPPQASFDYWFNNGIGLILVGIAGVFFGGGALIVLIIL